MYKRKCNTTPSNYLRGKAQVYTHTQALLLTHIIFFLLVVTLVLTLRPSCAAAP